MLKLAALALILALAVYGFDYYTLGAADRPFSTKHVLLKPSGRIGVRLGFLGFGMFLTIFLCLRTSQEVGMAGAAGKRASLARFSRLAWRQCAVRDRVQERRP